MTLYHCPNVRSFGYTVPAQSAPALSQQPGAWTHRLRRCDMANLTCSIDGCERPLRYPRLGWCNTHYERWRVHGTTDKKSSSDRFWERVDVGHPLGCWLWTGSLTRGYGSVTIDEVHWYAHRWAYTTLVGEIPEGLHLDHLCRNPPCVNPDHLEPVTHTENMRRGFSPAMRAKRAGACKRGHPRTPANTYVRRDGNTMCWPCQQMRNREVYRKRVERKRASL